MENVVQERHFIYKPLQTVVGDLPADPVQDASAIKPQSGIMTNINPVTYSQKQR